MSNASLLRRVNQRPCIVIILLGRAVDLCMFDKFTGELSWNLPDFALLDKFIQTEADRFGVHITWGGHWVTLRDGPHWQLEAL